jgi:hypothetical protein
LVAEDVKVDNTGGVDVRVVDLGYEPHFGRSKGIIDWDDNVLQYRVVQDAWYAREERSMELTTSK